MNAGALVAAAVVLGGAGAVAATQPKLARLVHDTKQLDDVYAIPPPQELKVLTLGYAAATVDALFAKLRVDYGTHWHDKRPFPDVPRFFDAIIALEPDYLPIYRMAETFLCYRPPVGNDEDAHLTRKYLELGTKNRPNDYRVWTYYGEFLTWTAKSFLTDDAEKDRWADEGAAAVIKAVELGATTDRSVAAAAVLNRAGKRDAAVRTLYQALQLTDDPGDRARINAKLDALHAEAEKDASQRNFSFFQSWLRGYTFLRPTAFLLLFPPPDIPRCVGLDSSWFSSDGLQASDDVRDCAPAWGPRLPSARGETPLLR